MSLAEYRGFMLGSQDKKNTGMDGQIDIAIPVDGEYIKWGRVAAQSAIEDASLPVRVHYIDWSVCDRDRFASFGEWHGSSIAWSRLFLSEILPADVDWVISSDADMLFRGDIAKLWQLRDERYVVMMSRDSMPPWHKCNPEIEKYCNVNGLDAGEILCSGLTLINLKRWRNEGWQAKMDLFLEKHAGADFLDQFALNVVFSEVKCALPPQWGCFSGDANEAIDYSGACAIHYVCDPPWRRGKLTQLMSDAVVLWRKAARMDCGGWRRWLYLLLRSTNKVWKWNKWMRWHYRNALVRHI